MRDRLVSNHFKEMSPEQWKNRHKAVNVIKEKKSEEIKGESCADGRVQCNFV